MSAPTESFRIEDVNQTFTVDLQGERYNGCVNILQFTWENTEGDESSEDGICEFFIDEAEIGDEYGNDITGPLFDRLIDLVPASMIRRWCEYEYEKLENERQAGRF